MSLNGRALFVFRGIVYSLLAISIAIAAYVYMLFCPSTENEFVNTALFHPSKVKEFSPEMYLVDGVCGRDVFFRYNKKSPKLHGIFYEHPEEKLVAIVNHGNGNNIVYSRPCVQALLACGVSVLIYDYRGFGMSEGAPTVSGVVEDAHAAYVYVMKELKYKPDQLIVYGGSLGTGISSELLKSKTCLGIIYDSPFLSPEKLAKEVLPYFNVYPTFLWFKPTLDNTVFVEGKHPPILFVGAVHDSIIPISHGKRLYELCAGEKKMHIFQNSLHTWYEADFDEYKGCISQFVNRLPSRKNRALK